VESSSEEHRKPYIKFDTEILEGYLSFLVMIISIDFIFRKSLLIQDEQKNLGALVISHMPQSIFWADFTSRIQMQFKKEFFKDYSDRKGYDFLAIHYHWYNRYAEKVSSAQLNLKYINLINFREPMLQKMFIQTMSKMQTLLE
jgi:hypothetical protein